MYKFTEKNEQCIFNPNSLKGIRNVRIHPSNNLISRKIKRNIWKFQYVIGITSLIVQPDDVAFALIISIAIFARLLSPFLRDKIKYDANV